MRTLVIETASAACSVALFEGGELVDERHELVGRGHAERLIPQIAELPGQGRADAILIDVGPGSFTGVRVGVAAARGLAIGWGAEVSGFSSLALIAAAGNGGELAVAIAGGHGQWFVQSFAGKPLAAMTALASLTPERAARDIAAPLVTGNAAAELVALRGWGEARDGAQRARDAMRLPAALRALAPTPLYGRAPDARPMAAR